MNITRQKISIPAWVGLAIAAVALLGIALALWQFGGSLAPRIEPATLSNAPALGGMGNLRRFEAGQAGLAVPVINVSAAPGGFGELRRVEASQAAARSGFGELRRVEASQAAARGGFGELRRVEASQAPARGGFGELRRVEASQEAAPGGFGELRRVEASQAAAQATANETAPLLTRIPAAPVRYGGSVD